jgi:hypothetical protein
MFSLAGRTWSSFSSENKIRQFHNHNYSSIFQDWTTTQKLRQAPTKNQTRSSANNHHKHQHGAPQA